MGSVHDHQKASTALMHEILGDGYLELEVQSHVFEEDIKNGQSKIRATVAPVGQSAATVKTRTVEGGGVGLVDAFFRGLIDQFSPEYPSLRTIRFIGFTLTAKIDRDRPRGVSGSDAVGEVRLLIENSEGDAFEFLSASRSITASALQATLNAVEYFVNSEKAFLISYRALKDAQSRGRADLVQTFSRRLSDLVKNTSYSEAIEAARKDL